MHEGKGMRRDHERARTRARVKRMNLGKGRPKGAKAFAVCAFSYNQESSLFP